MGRQGINHFREHIWKRIAEAVEELGTDPSGDYLFERVEL